MILDFLIGNIICAAGTLLLIREVYKNRNILKGYGLIGPFLTFAACCWFTRGFFILGDILSVVFALITIAFWLMVTLYQLKRRLIK